MKGSGDKVLVGRLLPALQKSRRPVHMRVYAINLSHAGIQALCAAVQHCSSLTYVLLGWNPDATLEDYEDLKAAVAASPSPIKELRIVDDKKTPEIDVTMRQATLKVLWCNK